MATTYISKIQAIGSADEYIIKDAEARSNLDSHVHGNISRDGKVSQTAAIASGDKLLIADSSGQDIVIGSAITFGTSTTTFLSNSGTWATPAITGFDSAKTIALTGDVTGSASGGNGSNGWSIATTIGSGKVTNAMLAGSIANGKLANSKVTIAGNDISLGGSLAADTLRSSLGLSNAMHFKGTTTTTMSDGLTTAAVIIGGSSYTPEAGDVVLYSDSEFVWTGSAWERLGRDSSFKVTQTAVTDTAYSGTDTSTTFVTAVTQNANGEITVTKRKLPTYNNYSHPTTTAVDAAAVKVGKDNLGHVVIGDALTKSDVGLGNVENTKLSTWAGSSNITTIGTLSSGTVPWARLSGVPSSFTPSSHTHNLLVTEGDNRTVATTPNDYSNKIIFRGLKTNSSFNSPSTDTYSYVIGLRGWSDSSGGDSHELAFNNTGLYWRHGATTSWGNWARIYTTANKPTKSDVGLGNVENTALSTWAGSGNITTIGTLSSGTVPWARLSNVPSSFTPSAHTHYWASVETTSAATYNTAPEMATLKLNGNTSASAASTSNVTLVFDATLQALNFVFA